MNTTYNTKTDRAYKTSEEKRTKARENYRCSNKCKHAWIQGVTETYHERNKRWQAEERLEQFELVKQQYGECVQVPENDNYYVFRNGYVYSFARMKFIGTSAHRSGYRFINSRYYVGGKKKQLLHHQLVFFAWHGSIPSGEFEINHKNLDKTDCSIDNLEIVTHRENIDHAVKNGAFKKKKNKSSENQQKDYPANCN